MLAKWESWNHSQKAIFIAGCFAALSFFLPWVDIGIATRNGFSQGSVLVGILLLPPLISVIYDRNIKFASAIIGTVIATIYAIYYIFMKTMEVGLMGERLREPINVSAIGSHLFLVACLMMLYGIVADARMKKSEPLTQENIEDSPSKLQSTRDAFNERFGTYKPFYRILFIILAVVWSALALEISLSVAFRILYFSNEQVSEITQANEHYYAYTLIAIAVSLATIFPIEIFRSLRKTSTPHQAKKRMVRVGFFYSAVSILLCIAAAIVWLVFH